MDVIEEQLKKYEKEQRIILKMVDDVESDHWKDDNPTYFRTDQKSTTTLLTTGFPEATMNFFANALKPAGFTIKPFKTPANSALEIGKEFGNRGQCNPTYFTVGSLVEHLIDLRDNKKMPTKEIIENYVYVTAGGCGPCRMGMYATEYRKALRDSGFEGFRVLLIARDGLSSSVDASALQFKKSVILRAFMGIILGDIVNALCLRIRCYEVDEGSTDRAEKEVRKIIENAFAESKSLSVAAYKCRKIYKSIKVDRSRVIPKVLIQGEFWAKATEGDGNYNLFRFLEAEGAEPVIESTTDWLLHQVWRTQWELNRREKLKRHDNSGSGLKGKNIALSKFGLTLVDRAFRAVFYWFAYLIGLKGYKLTDNEHIAELAHEHFDAHLEGGEDHMEVGHHINTVKEKLATMVLSVKPFTCLSSNGVSDGIQGIVGQLYPQSIFASVETNGDAPANFYSRIQMQLFKAKKSAQADVEAAYKKYKITEAELKEFLERKPSFNLPLNVYPHEWACPVANLIAAAAQSR